MGITGLIPFIEKASRKVDIDELSGSTVAIDAYCWLHKGIIGCAEKLMRGEKTNVHINYCMKQVNYLLSRHIRPILVFDGRHLAAKAGVEAERRESRKAAKVKAKDLIAQGRNSEARSFIQRALDVSHKMALELIEECHSRGVDCIVAPYEADGQLAYLNLTGIVDYVITEDSDLILFGCNKILFKFNFTGGLLFEANKLHHVMGVRKEKFTFTKFRQMCILSGCDYLPSLPGIGLAKAKKFMLMTDETDMRRALAKIPNYLGLRQVVVTEEYKEGFLKAEATFQYMIVYDPRNRKLTRLNELQEGLDENLLTNSGEFFDEDLAYQLALGNIDPMSLKKLHDWDPDEQIQEKFRSRSIWGNNKENGNHKAKRKESPTEDEIQAEHLKSIKMSFLSKLDYQNDQDDQEETEDLVSSYISESSRSEPPKKKLRTTNMESPRKSTNIFKVKPKEQTPVKSPLKSPNQCNVSLIASVSSKTHQIDACVVDSNVTPKKDLFAIAKQKTEEIISPAALKLLKMVQEKLKQPQSRRIRVTNDEDTTKTPSPPKEIISSEITSTSDIECESISSDNEIMILTPSTETSEEDLNSTPIQIEPAVILIEDDSPLPIIKKTVEIKPKIASRGPGLTKRKAGTSKTLTKSNSQQMKLNHFGFIANKKL
uniref:Exonuclease 1 n=1 Tax=Culicoides sonorensis TaxID=179676 RepID=A0A336LMH7_CULSO